MSDLTTFESDIFWNVILLNNPKYQEFFYLVQRQSVNHVQATEHKQYVSVNK